MGSSPARRGCGRGLWAIRRLSRTAAEKVAEAGRWHRLPDPLPLPDESCDQVVFALVADHIRELGAVLSELARVAKPGGAVLFSVLHPAMNLAGITARFFDPRTGAEVRVDALEHSVADYVTAVLRGGLKLAEIVERKIDREAARCSPRAAKYLGWPLLLAMRLRKP